MLTRIFNIISKFALSISKIFISFQAKIRSIQHEEILLQPILQYYRSRFIRYIEKNRPFLSRHEAYSWKIDQFAGVVRFFFKQNQKKKEPTRRKARFLSITMEERKTRNPGIHHVSSYASRSTARMRWDFHGHCREIPWT